MKIYKVYEHLENRDFLLVPYVVPNWEEASKFTDEIEKTEQAIINKFETIFKKKLYN